MWRGFCKHLSYGLSPANMSFLAALRADKERTSIGAMNEVLRPQERNKLSYCFEFFNFKRRHNDLRMGFQ